MERVVIKKNGRERIEISVQEFGGKPYLDIRQYYFDADADEWKPTKKGIAIPAPLTRSVLRGVKKVGAAFLDMEPPAQSESSGIQRKEKKVKTSKEQRKMQRALAESLASATEKASKPKKKKKLDGDIEELIAKSAKAGVDKALKKLSEKVESTVTKIKKKKRVDEDDVQKTLKTAVKMAKKHLKKVSEPIGPDGKTKKQRKKDKLKAESKSSVRSKRPTL